MNSHYDVYEWPLNRLIYGEQITLPQLKRITKQRSTGMYQKVDRRKDFYNKNIRVGSKVIVSLGSEFLAGVVTKLGPKKVTIELDDRAKSITRLPSAVIVQQGGY
jgi:hypothetical protein